MTNTIYPVDFALLSICALMDSFNYSTLNALSDRPKSSLDSLLASNLVVRLQNETNEYCLQADVKKDVIAQLRTERLLDELEFHTRAFEYFFCHVEQNEHSSQNEPFERHYMHHLDNLFSLLSPRREWDFITTYLAKIKEVKSVLPQHQHRISFYEGHIAVKTQNYDLAKHIFQLLLEEFYLEDEFRIRTLNGLALVYMDLTYYDRALEIYYQVHTLSHKNSNFLYQGAALLNMSMIQNELGYYSRALELTEQSLHIFRSIDHTYGKAHALYELGNSSLRLGRWEPAKHYFTQAIDLYKSLDLKSLVGTVYFCQGLLNHILGNEIESESVYLRSLDILLAPECNNSKIGSEVLWHLGLLYHTQNRWDEAIDAYDRALALARKLQRPHYISLILYQRGNLFKRLGRVEETEEAYRQAIETIETLRGATEGEEIKIGLLGTTQQIYESMVLLCLEQGRLDEAFAYVERARSRAFLDTLAKKDPEVYAALDEPIATLSDVQQQLPEDALLIEYFTTGVLPRGEHMLNNLPKENERLRECLTLPPKIIIFAITRDGFEVHQLDRSALDPNALRPKEHDPDPSRRLLSGRMRNHLYKQLLGPVEHLLRDRNLLYLVPHGPLHSVPFMALQSGTGSYLLDHTGPAVALAPSATVLLHSCLRRPKVQDGQFLALGYDDAEHNLYYAETEVQQIARLMDGEAWTGSEPKSEALFAIGPQLRWLHIAGHAAYNPRAPLDSELFLGADDRLSARTIMNRLHLRAAGVTLSACMSGLGQVVAGDELLGMQRAWLYAGAPTIVCTLWETADLVALLIMEHFYTSLRAHRPAAAALRDAQVAVRELTVADLIVIAERWRAAGITLPDMLNDLATTSTAEDNPCPFADPQYWAPFMLVGRPE